MHCSPGPSVYVLAIGSALIASLKLKQTVFTAVTYAHLSATSKGLSKGVFASALNLLPSAQE